MRDSRKLLLKEVHQGVVHGHSWVVGDQLVLLLRHDPGVLDKLLDPRSLSRVLIKHKLNKG